MDMGDRGMNHQSTLPLTIEALSRHCIALEALHRTYAALGYGLPQIRKPCRKPNGMATVRIVWRQRPSGLSICHTVTVPMEAVARHV
jgi:hypothetical protein